MMRKSKHYEFILEVETSLAAAIMKSVPDDTKAACTGHATSETLRWLEGLERQLDAGFLPEAFDAYSNDDSRWRLVNLTGRNGDSFIEPQPGYNPPGHEPHIVDDPQWRHGVAAWNEVAGHATVTLPLAELAHDEASFEFADPLRRAFADVSDGFEARQLLRAAIGSLLIASTRSEIKLPGR
jgi:hypothetical protein